MAAKKLHYFNLNGIAESIRYILHYGGEKFEDVRYELSTWPDKKVKDTLPYGQLPLYEEGKSSLNQSLAIARYVAAKAGLVPKDLWEQAQLDAVVFNIYDFWSKIVPYIKEQDATKKAAIKKEILEDFVDFYFSRFEKHLRENNGVFGKNNQLSWADFILVGIVESGNLFLGKDIAAPYPTIRALITKIHTLPGVKNYLATRKPYTL